MSLDILVNNKPCISETKTKFKMPKKANIFESFSHSAIQQFKEAFGIMDTDKDGLLSSSDLVAAFAAHGKNVGGGEAQVSISYFTLHIMYYYGYKALSCISKPKY